MADYDCVVIGGGPAGLTAGMYLARARVNCVLFEGIACGGQIMTSDWIENYPGFPEGLAGSDLVVNMEKQARHFGLDIQSRQVLCVDFSGAEKKLSTSDGEITAKSVIIATGAKPRKLGVPGEDMFYGKGVSTCATCDGPFYRNKTVAAVGGGDTAVQEAMFLTRFVDKVYLIHRRDRLRAARILQERALANPKIEFVWNSVLKAIHGLDSVEKVTVENVKNGKTSDLEVSGCFIWVGIQPATDFLGQAVGLDERGFVLTNAAMETSAPGVFAAGDVRNTPLRQVATAVGDAAIAAHSVEHFLENA